MRPGCPELVRMLKEIPEIEQVTMTTNGVLLAQFLPELLECGLDAVNVSLDTLNREVYRQITGRDELGKAMEGIRQALAGGIRVKANVVLQRGVNEKEWKALADLTKKHFLDVRFIEMMPIGYGKDYETVSNEELLVTLKQEEPGLFADTGVHGNGPAVYYRMPGAKGSIGFISAMHGKFCGSCNRLRLTSVGKLKPCLCFENSVDIRKILRESKREETEGLLDQAIREAVQKKPKQHKFEMPNDITERKQMVQIGG